MGKRQSIEPRPCQHCGRLFRPRSTQLRQGASRFCSCACAVDGRRLPDRACERCGRLFHVSPYSVKMGYARFCGRECWRLNFGSLQERFWKFVEKSDGCWLWTASITTRGYGQIAARDVSSSPLRAHRLSWEIHFGDIPDDLEVCHSCDANYPPGDITYRRCVRPDHLWLGTHAENLADMKAKKRSKRVKSS